MVQKKKATPTKGEGRMANHHPAKMEPKKAKRKCSSSNAASVNAANNSNGNHNKRLPGRAVLLALVAFVAIFLDFESSSLSSFVVHPTDGTVFDAKKAMPYMEQELGRMQQYQLERQWVDYKRRTENQSDDGAAGGMSLSDGPQEIIVEEELDLQEKAGENNTNGEVRVSNESLISHVNFSVEEIVLEPVNTTDAAILHHATNSTKIHWTNETGSVAEEIVIASSDQCFPHNTQEWLHGTRLSNAAYNLTDEFVYRQILIQNPLHPNVLAQISSDTICHADSKFRNPSLEWDVGNEQLIDEWEFRLIYMAIHHHHHAPAMPEAKARQACPREINVSKMDYQCPSSKFLVSNIAPHGLGASFRLGAVSTVLMGIATNRVSVFVNNFGDGPKFLSEPSQLASCERGDMQCFYLPTTPCTLLAKDLQNATILPEVDARDLRRQGVLDKQYVDASILILEPRLTPPKAWTIQAKIQSRLFEIAMTLIDGIRDSAPEEQIRVLEMAASRIKTDNATVAHDANGENMTEYVFSNRHSKTAHAALMYVMRPNANYQRQSDEMVASIVPEDIDRSLSIGLPIRGSDKCKTESMCYDFDQYMKLMKLMWDTDLHGLPGEKGNIILTTEDPNVLKARKAYEGNNESSSSPPSLPFRFIVNDKDILQGSGAPKVFKDRADSIMLASIVSLKLQMQAKYVVGNCCSNFHLMLFDFVHAGCGAVTESRAMCLQEHPDPQFHICCGWSRTEECDKIRDAQAEESRRRKNETALNNQTFS